MSETRPQLLGLLLATCCTVIWYGTIAYKNMYTLYKNIRSIRIRHRGVTGVILGVPAYNENNCSIRMRFVEYMYVYRTIVL